MTLYATDLDGTLLRPDKSISDETAEILNGLVSDGVLLRYGAFFFQRFPAADKAPSQLPRCDLQRGFCH